MKSKSPKRKQNKTAQKKKSIINFLIKPLIKLTLLVLVIWGSGYCVSALWKSGIKWLDGTSWGRLQEVRITGLERLSESDIFAVVKLDSGCSLMYFPFDSVAALISAIPAIKKARVLRRLPGLLKIDISERHPIAVLCNDGLRFIDGECQVFNPKPSGEVIDLPLITGLTSVDSTNMFRSVTEAVTLIEVIRIQFPNTYRFLSEVEISNQSLRMKLRQSGAIVRTKEEISSFDLELLEKFLIQTEKKLPAEMEYVDLTFNNIVAAR